MTELRAADRTPESQTPELIAIGAAAKFAGVSPRTLRWYQELGLLEPSVLTTGGARRYSPDDLARLAHIRQMQSILGFDLMEIRELLRGEDELAGLRMEYHSGPDVRRRREIVTEAASINNRLRDVVAGKQLLLEGMMRDLVEKSERYQTLLAEMSRAKSKPS